MVASSVDRTTPGAVAGVAGIRGCVGGRRAGEWDVERDLVARALEYRFYAIRPLRAATPSA